MTERSVKIDSVERGRVRGIFGFSHPLLEKIGAVVVNLVGASVALNSFDYIRYGSQNNSLRDFTIGIGGLLIGSTVIVCADKLKERVWRKEQT